MQELKRTTRFVIRCRGRGELPGHQRQRLRRTLHQIADVSHFDSQAAPVESQCARPPGVGGVATQLPSGQSAIRIERMILEPGESIPESAYPTMISVEDGKFDFTTVSGNIQVTRSADPGPRDPAELDEDFSLAPADAAFFPEGMAEVERPETDGQLSILQLTIYPIEETADGATPVASPVAEGGNLAVIEITEPEEPTPAPTQEAGVEPTEAADAPPGELAIGATVAVTEAEVRLRDAPTVNSNIVSGLDQGAEFTITDGPVEADGFVWWAVQSTADPNQVGWIAADFIAPV